MTSRSQRPYRFGTTLADLIWPPRSLLSDARVDCLGTQEADLWRALDFLHGPGCMRCGLAIAEATSPDILCPVCLAQPPLYDQARAALAHDDLSKPLVLNLKHAGRKDRLRAFSAWMLEAAPFVAEAVQILPVPLHWARLWHRGYNQAGWLATALAKRVGRPYNPLLLQCKRATPSQNGLSASGRKRNVTGAFHVSQSVKGHSLVLVDDVMTTGATLQASTAALRSAGAVLVDCVALARVVRPTKIDVPSEPIGSPQEFI